MTVIVTQRNTKFDEVLSTGKVTDISKPTKALVHTIQNNIDTYQDQ